MKFDVYCDESRPDLFSSDHPPATYVLIGSLWLPFEHRIRFKSEIHGLRDTHRIGGESKWQKVSPSRLSYYEDLIDWFFTQRTDLRFRCIAVDHTKVDLLSFHNNDQELGFYKFYYQMLHQWILDNNEYSIFCDFKSNRERNRLDVLRRCLLASNLTSRIVRVQAIRSRESVLMQLTDVLTGAVAARLNKSLTGSAAKEQVVESIERHIGRTISHTQKSEQKFNIFVIRPGGGW